ncbi:ABC transporter permease [Sulfitobacter sp. M57]|uniref:ABC transporter permease n=1 Tax=unclassified Sulfitobacter TaxID=196795 RepID=UPI0023E32773|nr:MULTISPECIES: ABC transporter permease [unclassified Sulfitobacter]MDF3414403.1 ABC transporter permease [Sulfitobacter sp. KE5]MDF3420315.1 ABC transporter permease [Sulfitobacter sp. KE43]MDF3432949.1 ABC transporter permease [Sulfitobacter sp. KE42]MDF3458589.1 ABC transporter permease [Sulfitobacter sp. S74]MDF3462489.1 ABC transporter permease [Sulfitobacter sp. Ks18]
MTDATIGVIPVQSTPARKGTQDNKLLKWTLQNVVWIWLVALVVLFGLFNEFFFTIFNMQNIMVQATVLGMLGLAMCLPLLVAEIDLSIPANMGFSSAVGAIAMAQLGLPWWIGGLIGVTVATGIGFFNGLCITRLKMVSLIQTLSMMIILQGALLAMTRGKTLTELGDGYTWIGQATVAGGWPIMPLVFIASIIGLGVLLTRTVFGRSVYAVGGNPTASNSAGIRVDAIKIKTYALSGFLAGIAGMLLASWQMAITSNQGESFLLYAIAAPITGGVSVFGGRGNVVGVLGGVLLLTVIQVGLAIISVPSFYVGMIGGFMIFVAVAIDAFRVRMFG